MRSLLVLATLLATVVGSLGRPAPAAGAESHTKVAIIVGPVGEELTPVYISLAEAAAKAAVERGAEVARAYSPNADEKSVRKAVRDANIVIYFGHGVGTPNPYSDTPNPATTNGWGLNGPNRRGDHSDSFADGTLTYYGESWITQHAKPAPGWVMIYSNACYAPGAGEGQYEPATKKVARRAGQRLLPCAAGRPRRQRLLRHRLLRGRRASGRRAARRPRPAIPRHLHERPAVRPRRACHGAPRNRGRRRDLAPQVARTSRARSTTGTPSPATPTRASAARMSGGPPVDQAPMRLPMRRRRCAIRRPRDRQSPRSTGRSRAWPRRTRRAVGWEGKATVALPAGARWWHPGRDTAATSSSAPTDACPCPSSTPVRATSAPPMSESRTSRTRRGARSATCHSRRASSRSRSRSRPLRSPTAVRPPADPSDQPTLTSIVWCPRAPSHSGRVRSSV